MNIFTAVTYCYILHARVFVMMMLFSGKGVIKLTKLFGTAKHLYTDGVSNVFVKSGSYNDAIADFYNLKPTHVKKLHENGKVFIIHI